MASTSRPASVLDRAGFLLSQLGHHSAAGFGSALAELDLTPRHFGLLEHLTAGGPQTQQQLADVLGVHRNVMVGLVDELEQRGLVERRRDERDRRAYSLHLTDRAAAILPAAERIADRHDKAVCAPLTAVERRQLLALLHKLADAAGLRRGVHPGYTGSAAT